MQNIHESKVPHTPFKPSSNRRRQECNEPFAGRKKKKKPSTAPLNMECVNSVLIGDDPNILLFRSFVFFSSIGTNEPGTCSMILEHLIVIEMVNICRWPILCN